MEHIIGIKFKHKDGTYGAYITWGRIFDDLDDADLLEIVSKKPHVLEAKLCRTLQEVKHYPYFYEVFWQFPAYKDIPDDPKEYQK